MPAVPDPIRILIVVDSQDLPFTRITFSPGHFSLYAAIRRLRAAVSSPVQLVITTAHRQTDTLWDGSEETKPDHEHFRFDQDGLDLDAFHQVWLFGIRREDDQALTDEEVAILARFMDAGGGVFAAGDHEDLGAALCSKVPRVRSMRRWKRSEAPPVDGEHRHDTLERGHDDIYTFDDESDDVPQRIEVDFPLHPLLAYGDGFIDVLPDHPHEGEVVPDEEIALDQRITVGDYEGEEFPGDARPRTIAWATVNPDHTECTDRNKGAAQGRRFGVLGVYDGRAVGVGRVVVDSTWHHWFDVNLTGRPVEYLDRPPYDESNPKTRGFLASDEGRLHLDRIYTLFLNVALWLAPQECGQTVLVGAVVRATSRPPVVELVEAGIADSTLGRTVRRTLERRHGREIVADWLRCETEGDLFGALGEAKQDEFVDTWLGILARRGADGDLRHAAAQARAEAIQRLGEAWAYENAELQRLRRQLASEVTS